MLLPTAIFFWGKNHFVSLFRLHQAKFKETPMEQKTSSPRAWKQILAIAWPLIVANSFWNLQLTIDRIYLGAWSTEALGAAMAVMGVFWTPMALLQQTAGYVTTFVAQYFGAREHEKIGSSRLAGHILQYRRRSPFPRIFVRVIRYLHHDRTLAGHA